MDSSRFIDSFTLGLSDSLTVSWCLHEMLSNLKTANKLEFHDLSMNSFCTLQSLHLKSQRFIELQFSMPMVYVYMQIAENK